MSATRYGAYESMMPLLGHPLVNNNVMQQNRLGRIKHFIIIVAMKILQLGRPTYHGPRLCRRCSPSEDPTLHELLGLNASPDQMSLQTDCVVCESLNWGDRGQFIPMEVIRPNEVARSCWYWAVSLFGFLYLSLVFALLVYDSAVFFALFWGERRSLLFLVSYYTYTLQLMVVPMICIWGRLQPKYLFREGYVRDRLRFLTPGMRNVTTLTLVVCIIWPISCAVLRLAFDICLSHNSDGQDTGDDVTHHEIGHWAALIGYILYGCFCIIVYTIKCSLRHECRLVIKFVCMNSTSLNSSRKRTDELFRDFKKFRDFTNKWLLFSASIGLIGVFCQITWNYNIEKYKNITYDLMWNFLIWDQKIMFAVLPFICVAGLNAEYLWHKLVYDMSMMRDTDNEKYWKKTIKHVIALNFEARKPDMMFLFTLISVYMGLQLTKKDIFAFINIMTSLNSSVSSSLNLGNSA